MRSTKRQDPATPEQWQDAVDGARFYLAIDDCRQYGLITGAPRVNVQRCLDILRRGRQRGISPAPFEELCRKFIDPA